MMISEDRPSFEQLQRERDALAARVTALSLENTSLRADLATAQTQLDDADTARRDSLLLRAYMDRSNLRAWLKDERGRLVYANRQWFEQLGLDEAAAIGKSDFELLPADVAARERAHDLDVLGGHEPTRMMVVEDGIDGDTRSWLVTRFPFHNARGERFVGGIAQDDTARARHYEEIRRQSITDSLTGLLNRRGFDTLAAPELSRARRRGSACTLALVDLDGLKGVNDRLGHAAGDAIIALAAMILRKVFRATDIVARIGGDEFAIFAPDTDGDADAIRRRLDQAVADLSSNPILEAQLGFSIGLLDCPASGREPLDALLATADARMYEQKRGKR